MVNCLNTSFPTFVLIVTKKTHTPKYYNNASQTPPSTPPKYGQTPPKNDPNHPKKNRVKKLEKSYV